jgi:hypothetical protein
MRKVHKFFWENLQMTKQIENQIENLIKFSDGKEVIFQFIVRILIFVAVNNGFNLRLV